MISSTINIASQPIKLSDTDIVVGKDILELLVNGMYLDPLTIYREYVQNAADSIDEIRMAGLSVNDPHITIHLDHIGRTVRIRDNGGSIPNREFVKQITAIGASHKRGTSLRGFRGIGRLSGLGYCQELVFRGKAAGDSKIIEVSWDGRTLKEKIRDHSYSGSLIDIIREVVTYRHIPSAEKSECFFEVELRKVQRLKSDLLMNEKAIRLYLSQVAPVPFHPEFSFGEEIQEFLIERGMRQPIKVELDDGAGPIYHRARDTIDFNPNISDTLRGIEYVELHDSNGELSAFGWIADHGYMGSIPKKLGLSGIRLRAGNIQVGDESMLAPLYPETRFASWAMGDIHVNSKKIIPNGRRDDFEHTPHYNWLRTELSAKAEELAHRIRMRSKKRQHLRNVETHLRSIDDWYGLAKERGTPLLLKKALLALSSEQVQKAAHEAKKLGISTDDHNMATERLNLRTKDIRGLERHIERKSLAETAKLPQRAEKVLLTALKVVLSNARSAKTGTRTALDIVEAIGNIR